MRDPAVDEILNPPRQKSQNVWLESLRITHPNVEGFLARVNDLHQAYETDPCPESQARLSEEAVKGALALYKEASLEHKMTLDEYLSKKGVTYDLVEKTRACTATYYPLPKEQEQAIYRSIAPRISDPSVDISLSPNGALKVVVWNT